MIPLPGHPGLRRPLRSIKGVGPRIEEILKGRGFNTLGDLLTLMPVRYQDRRALVPLSDLGPGMEALTSGVITAQRRGRYPKTGRGYVELEVTDGPHRLVVRWFNGPGRNREFEKGSRMVVFGKVTEYQERLQMVHPEVVPWKEEEGGLQPEIRPVYPEIDSLKPGTLRRIMAEALHELMGVPPIFPREWLKAHGLTDPIRALRTLHHPPARGSGGLPRPAGSKAWRSLALFELLFLQLILARSRARQGRLPGHTVPLRSGLAEAFQKSRPFDLTSSQKSALQEIRADMSRPRPMNRLLQGDVGSGKTVVALAAVFAAVDSGKQVAIMVPTEMLARQHFQRVAADAERLGVRAELLVGGLPEPEKKDCRDRLSSGRSGIVVGTQALISSQVSFQQLGLAVIDEQHRFGVGQRLALREKADHPDILVMTATPIPRSLAMTLYGDLDLSIIQGLPPGRRPIRTKVVSPEDRDGAYGVLAREIGAGGQGYVIAPRIEPGDEAETETHFGSVERVFEYVRKDVLPHVPVGLVHRRMKPDEQRAVMREFEAGRVAALVATTVIEVGIDVPNACVILIEGAERFGLAQLHQLRGRVGRGGRPSHCFLLPGGNAEAMERLQILAGASDGFELAEEDLKRRGPGGRRGGPAVRPGFPHLGPAAREPGPVAPGQGPGPGHH